MELVIELLKILIPPLLVFISGYYVIRKMLEQEREKMKLQIRKEKAKDFTPIQLQAFERLILFLERISPNNMILRTHKTGMSARYLHLELIKTIRTEYEHNLVQQLYISHPAWQMVTGAKEEMLKLVNVATAGLQKDATANDLSKIIVEKTSEVKNLPTTVAISYLKKEMRRMF